VEEDELEREFPETIMSNPWDALKDEVSSLLRDEVKDFISETKPELMSFLKDKAETIAREKWAELKATTDDERELARSNLKHLRGQIGAEIARLQLASTERAGALLKKVLETTIGIVIRVGPALLGL
jgi:CO dehydrogenase/acetyl-CoA synthase beta subunit